MVSLAFLENLKKEQTLIVVGAMVLATVMGALLLWFFTADDITAIEEESTWQTAQRDPFGVEKADSDVVTIGDVTIPWPDKLSDIEENYIWGTDYRHPDTDRDGMEDGWEALYARPNPITGRLTIDPNVWDPYENPDGDGFDLNGNGVIDKHEALFNLREYVGGVEWDWVKGHFTDNDTVFGGLNPEFNWQEIGMRGGFHLYDDPLDGIFGDRTNPDDDLFDDYLRYNPYLPDIFKPVTTNPSLWDTDGDGIDDGWELHYARIFDTEYFDEGETRVYQGSVNTFLEAIIEGPLYYIEVDGKEVEFKPGMISPLNPADARYDMDVRFGYTVSNGVKTEVMIYARDDLNNLEEYENQTSPLLWDTDGDSYYNAIKGTFYNLNDFIEVNIEYTQSAVDWSNDGLLNFKTCPFKADTDGDGMPDGWELSSNLDPLNSSDRFKDLDGDGLPNYLEMAFPNRENMWFQTDPLNPDTDGDGMLDGWEAYNAMIISRSPALNLKEDLEDKIIDGFKTIYTVSPMIADGEEDNDGTWNITDTGEVIYVRTPDGLTNYEEFIGTTQYPVSTNPNYPDTDGDGLFDGVELKVGFVGELIGGIYYTNPDIAGTYYTNATLADSDNDWGGSEIIGQRGNTSRRLDDWEETNGITKYVLPPNGFDDDGDGVIDNEGEKLVFSPTNATNPDSDLDGWLDVDELFGIDTTLLWSESPLGIVRTDPNKWDTDNDMMSDYDELIYIPNYRPWITDPNNPDTDGDGMEDGLENTVDFFPLIDWNKNDNYDANGDGDYDDEGDIFSTVDRTNPTMWDTDQDSLPDGWEYRMGKCIKNEKNKRMIQEYDKIYRTNYWNELLEGQFFWIINPLIASDVFDDPDRDGLNNRQEYENGTDPLNPDTDGDGMPDGWELDSKNRGPPIYHPQKRKYVYHLNPLSPPNEPDWCLDADHDGFIYSIWTPRDITKSSFDLVFYYFPFINLYEYQYGIDLDGDGINDITTSPAPRLPESGMMGGYDTDGDGMPDGWEVWVTDFIGNESKVNAFEDNDSLPKGWEDLFNGSAWERPECYIYEAKDNETVWDPWANSITVNRRTFRPAGLVASPDFYKGRLYSDRKDTNRNGVDDGDEDDDNDNYNNYIEYKAHTDPTDRESYPTKANIPALREGPPRAIEIDMGAQPEGGEEIPIVEWLGSLDPVRAAEEYLSLVEMRVIDPAQRGALTDMKIEGDE
ncbi:MAG: hypothetical protein QCI82_09475 [Candidatus Thermoplasmatota archaeon]|nr:hypothetical protein [Candidatus Thermoplasmatota archaeon]